LGKKKKKKKVFFPICVSVYSICRAIDDKSLATKILHKPIGLKLEARILRRWVA